MINHELKTRSMTTNLNETTPLLTALRQFSHNDGEGFVFGYDKEETDRIVAELIEYAMEITARDQRDAITKRYKVLKAALETVKEVLESDNPAIVDTVWVPDLGVSETLYDNVCVALECAHDEDVIRPSKRGNY